MTLIVPGASPAFVAQGRWVACCGHPERCDSAAALTPGVAGFICADCGSATDVIWPPAAMVEGITRLLLMRPNPKNQNWLPGETLPDLLAENVSHGVMGGYDFTRGSIGVAEDRIVTDQLPVRNPRRELVAGVH